MAKKKRNAQQLEGAGEFLGTDPEKDAIERIAAARAAAEKDKGGDNGGPIMDEDAWRRACNEYTAEMLTMEDLERQKSEVAGRISSIRKVAKKLKVDWDLVRRYYADHKNIRKGGMGAMVSDERRYRQLLVLMDSPLGTQFTLWQVEPEGATSKPSMEPELAGQHAWSNKEPRQNNPYQQGTEEFVQWDNGWVAAETHATAQIGRGNGAGAPAH